MGCKKWQAQYRFHAEKSLKTILYIKKAPERALVSGERGIRTPGPRKGTAVFKTAAFDHSAISPGLERDKNRLLLR